MDTDTFDIQKLVTESGVPRRDIHLRGVFYLMAAPISAYSWAAPFIAAKLW